MNAKEPGGVAWRNGKFLTQKGDGLLKVLQPAYRQAGGTFQRFGYSQFVSIHEFIFSDIVCYPYIIKDPYL
jgi:hypothetical protein